MAERGTPNCARAVPEGVLCPEARGDQSRVGVPGWAPVARGSPTTGLSRCEGAAPVPGPGAGGGRGGRGGAGRRGYVRRRITGARGAAGRRRDGSNEQRPRPSPGAAPRGACAAGGSPPVPGTPHPGVPPGSPRRPADTSPGSVGPRRGVVGAGAAGPRRAGAGTGVGARPGPPGTRRGAAAARVAAAAARFAFPAGVPRPPLRPPAAAQGAVPGPPSSYWDPGAS